MAGTVIADNLQAASTSQLVIKNGVANTPPTIQDSGGTQVGTFCRAWVNFNGTGTIAIRGSFNVSSITDVAAAQYTVNLTTAMPDTNYTAVVCGNNIISGAYVVGFGLAPYGGASYTATTTSFGIASGGTSDVQWVSAAVFR